MSGVLCAESHHTDPYTRAAAMPPIMQCKWHSLSGCVCRIWHLGKVCSWTRLRTAVASYQRTLPPPETLSKALLRCGFVTAYRLSCGASKKQLEKAVKYERSWVILSEQPLSTTCEHMQKLVCSWHHILSPPPLSCPLSIGPPAVTPWHICACVLTYPTPLTL